MWLPVSVPQSLSGRFGGFRCEPLKACLRATTHPRLSHWIDLDARASGGGIGAIEHYRFWVVDHRDRLVAGPRIVDVPRHGVALPPGRYRAFVSIADRAGAVEVASAGVVVGPEVRLLDCGAVMSIWGALTQIDLPTTAASIDLADVLKEASGATDSTSMWIQAFGATGGYGQNEIEKGGSPGAVGFAQTVTSLSGFKTTFGTTVVSYYLGDNGSHDLGGGDGGASTIMFTGSTWPTEIANVVVVAGGSGGGGEGGTSHGEDGGAGGIANAASSSSAVNGSGVIGGGDSGGGPGHNGNSGNQAAKLADQWSTDGIGGYGGTGSDVLREFTNGSAVDAGYQTTGRGGNSDGDGGAGGGGYGGGGGGVNETTKGSGGGGGGSYATGSTITTDTQAAAASNDSGSASGVMRIVFNNAVSG